MLRGLMGLLIGGKRGRCVVLRVCVAGVGKKILPLLRIGDGADLGAVREVVSED